jgi:glycosyltransferase involved in cell wall biosynthesis
MISSSPDISIVIPSFRSRSTIDSTIESLLAQDYDGKIEIVVADSSDDDTSAWLSKRFPAIKVFHSTERLLPGPARNFGASKVSTPLLGFVDSDVQVASNWVATLSQILHRDSTAKLLGASIKNENPESSASRVLYWIEFSEFLPGQLSGRRMALSSSNLLIRRIDFERLGGFDSKLGMSEDMLFSLNIGQGIHFESSTYIRHTHRTDWSVVKKHLFQLGYWSGRFRNQFAVSGSWLSHAPLLSFALIPYRFLRIIHRVFRFDPYARFLWRDSPRLLVGLWAWTRGFYQGIRGLPLL